MTRRGLRLLLVACALPLLWLLTRSALDVGIGLLFLAPALLLALPLLAGRYVGAERLSRVAARAPAVRRSAPGLLVPRRCPRVPPRGGLLIAASLAVRPPPLVLSA